MRIAFFAVEVLTFLMFDVSCKSIEQKIARLVSEG
jgi:hypothetical protein